MSEQDTTTEKVNLDRRKFILGGTFAAATALAAWRQPTKRIDYLGKRKLEDVIPAKVGSWEFLSSSGLVVPPEDQLSRLLYSEMLTRVYTNGDNAIMLLIAQSAGQTGVLQVHRPEVCYPAGGYTLSPVVQQPVSAGNRTLVTNSLTATADTRNEHILYWTRIGNHHPISWAQQRLVIATDNLRGYIPDAVLVRVSMVQNDRSTAVMAMTDFIRQLLGTMPAAARRVLIA